MAEDILPSVLTEQMMQPEQRQPEQDQTKEGGPRGDLVSCDRVCQGKYRSRASQATLQTARVGLCISANELRGSPRMSSTTDGRQATMDSTQIYREETFTDRKVGTIRCLTPVGADGAADSARPVIFVGQAQVMTPMGTVPISFELEATTLNVAIEKFGAAAEQAVHQTMRELQEMRREQASSLVIPDAAGGALPNPADLLGRGRSRR